GELVVLLLDGAGDPHGQYLVAEVATRLQVDGFVFPRLCEQTLDVLVGHGMAPGVVSFSLVSVEKRPGRDRLRRSKAASSVRMGSRISPAAAQSGSGSRCCLIAKAEPPFDRLGRPHPVAHDRGITPGGVRWSGLRSRMRFKL